MTDRAGRRATGSKRLQQTRRAPGARSRRVLALVAVQAALFTVCCGAEAPPADAGERLAVPDPPKVEAATVTIRGHAIDVDVARSRDAQRLGLGRYLSLDCGRGMLFPYAQAGFYSFWMKGMHFDIDIIWIREGRIVGIAARVPAPPEPDAPDPARARPRELVDLVLEVPAGYAQAQGWRRGDRVTVEPAD
jgi:uncharacterized membrane protein (UPF0127 family)